MWLQITWISYAFPAVCQVRKVGGRKGCWSFVDVGTKTRIETYGISTSAEDMRFPVLFRRDYADANDRLA